jgi:RNA polymerase sigma factor (sigma-70 family)
MMERVTRIDQGSHFMSGSKGLKRKSLDKGLTDDHLITLIHQGNREAFGELYHRYYKKVYRKCLSFTKDADEAFDLAQEALIKAFDKLYTFRGESTFSTWLFTITQRHCLAALKKVRKKNNTPFSESDHYHFDSPEPDAAHDRVEQETIMFSLIHALPATERQLLTMKYKDGESIETLQGIMDLSASAVKMRLKRSKERLNLLYGLAMTYGLEQVLSQI